MAVDRINNSGGINGRSIELVISDDASSPAIARQKVDAETDAVAGGGGQRYRANLVALPWDRYLAKLRPSDDEQASWISEWGATI